MKKLLGLLIVPIIAIMCLCGCSGDKTSADVKKLYENMTATYISDELENNPEIVNSEEGPDGPDVDIDLGPSRKPMAPPSTSDNPQMDDTDVEEEPEEENNAEQILPTPDQLNMDFTDNTQEF